MMKKCTRCKIEKDVGQYSRCAAKRDGLNIWCKSCAKSFSSDWYAKNKERRLAVARLWRESNLIRFSKSVAMYAKTERGKMAQAKYNASVNGKMRAKRHDATAKGAASQANERHRRRAMIADGRVSAEQWSALIEFHQGLCTYCGCGGKMTQDHDIPLSRGGLHDASNIFPACQSCNSRKHTKTAEEYVSFLLSLPDSSISPMVGRVNRLGLF